jgi:lysophospholipase L1-like esterase
MDQYKGSRIGGLPYDYIHRAGYRGRIQDVEVAINSRGLRTPEFSLVKAAGTRRVLILGDSVVFGWGVAQDDIVSAQCQRIADEQSDGKWEFIGAGVGSWNARNEYEYLVEEGDSIRPDVIVLVMTSNDAQPHPAGRTEVSPDSLSAEAKRYAMPAPSGFYRELVEHSYLFATIRFLRRAQTIGKTRPEESCAEGSASARDAVAALEDIALYCRDRDIQLVPYLYLKADSRCRMLFDRALRRQSVQTQNFPAKLDEKKYRNSFVDGHPNAEGHRIMAEHIMAQLISQTSG